MDLYSIYIYFFQSSLEFNQFVDLMINQVLFEITLLHFMYIIIKADLFLPLFVNMFFFFFDFRKIPSELFVTNFPNERLFEQSAVIIFV